LSGSCACAASPLMTKFRTTASAAATVWCMTTDEHIALINGVMTRSANHALELHRADLIAEGRPAIEIEQRLARYAEQLEQQKFETLAAIRVEALLAQATLMAHGVFEG
jgi:hypothetical protein